MLARFARFLLRVGGWTIIGERPAVPRAVVIAAPHTSNWDGYWALICKVALQIDNIHFFGKHSLFWFPLGNILRAMGGIPLDRGRAGSAVEQAVELLQGDEDVLFGLAPEGTRKRRDHWKTGFYRIAREANVPVVLAFLDFGRRRIGLGPTLYLTGNVDMDMDIIRGHYSKIEGHHPENASEIVFPENSGL